MLSTDGQLGICHVDVSLLMTSKMAGSSINIIFFSLTWVVMICSPFFVSAASI
jgi:hypothetical protein